MANTIIEFDYYPNRTLTTDTFPLKSDTADATADTCTEETNRKGKYRFVLAESVTGIKEVRIKEGGVFVGSRWTEPLVDDTNVYLADDRRVSVEQIQSDAQSATDLKAFADNCYSPALNRVKTDMVYTNAAVNDASATTTSFVTTITILPTGALNDLLISFTSGALIGQTKPIASYDTSTDTITVSEPFTEAPGDGDTFDIIRIHVHSVADIQSGLATDTELAKVPKSDGTTTWNATALGSVTTAATAATPVAASVSGNVDGSVGSVVGAVGSVTGAVGSVTGAVGSVTGNIGGNVAGSVGSVTGGINTAAGTIQTLDALDTAQDSQHSTTQTAVGAISTTIGAAGAGLTEAGGTGDQFTDIPKTGYSLASDGLDETAFEDRTLLAAAYGTAANQTTILARLGAFAGTGLNTVFGFLRALGAKAAGLTPSELSSGTTYDNTADSQEAIRDRGDAEWTGSGGVGGDCDPEEIADAVEVRLADRNIVIVSPVSQTGQLEIWQGDGYTGENAIEIPVEDWDGEDPSTYASLKFALMLTSDYNAGTGSNALEVDATGVLNSTTATFTIELTNEQTNALTPSPALDRFNYTYQLRAVEHGGDKRTIVSGGATVKRRVVG
jgi:hypothetical protein